MNGQLSLPPSRACAAQRRKRKDFIKKPLKVSANAKCSPRK
jgi:hypothetical protein